MTKNPIIKKIYLCIINSGFKSFHREKGFIMNQSDIQPIVEY